MPSPKESGNLLDGTVEMPRREYVALVAERDRLREELERLRAAVLNRRRESWIDTNEAALVFTEGAYKELCAALERPE